jgi:serine/threonine protein kinase/tetratricopeptide (TPR) repeat protein
MPEIVIQRIGRYEILQEIGRGAMGVVFKGRDPLIGRAVAVKTITSAVAESSDLLERFYREARAAGGLQHPNIVTIYELAESGGAPFIAMEYLEGESLEKLIARKPALPLATKVGYVVQACRALDYAHRHGVIHRDVKPANIVVTRDAIVKVVDFGIARLADTSKTQTGTLLGTLPYMSPQRVRGEQADVRGDIWALGVVLYELLAYQRPFIGENHAALLMSILQNEPPSLWQLVPQCPAALERVILKALHKDEKERYPSMEALLKNIENVNASLTREGSRAAIEKGTPSASDEQPRAANPRIDLSPSKSAAQIPGAESNVQPTRTILLHSHSISPAAIPVGAASIAKSGVRRPVKTILTPPASSASRPGRTAIAAGTILAIVLVVHAVVRRDEVLAMAAHRAWARIVNLASPGPAAHPLPLATLNTRTPTTATSAEAQTSQTADAETPAAASDPVLKPTPSSLASIEDQQRYLINLAHKAADWQDYKGAQRQLDDAEKLNGPLNDAIADLRRQFSAQSHGAELERVAREEQTFWDKAMAYLNAGDFDDAEESLRDILTLPEGSHRWPEAARYVDQVIPERRQEEQLWAAAQLQSSSQDPGHFLTAIKALDDVLAAGGRHEQGARQKRDALMTNMIRGDAERNGMRTPVGPDADQWQVTQLKNHFDDLVQKGNAAALEELQQLRSKFKSLAEAQGPLASDARDYLNNVIPKAQGHIEDRLAVAESNSSPNTAYMDAVKEYDRAVATQNASMLRYKVLPLFREIAQSGGVRAKEAQRYAGVLIPAALNKSDQ